MTEPVDEPVAVTARGRTPFLHRRWPVVLLALALAAAIALLPVASVDDDAVPLSELGAQLRAYPVYVAPGARGVLDVERARTAIGERPIAVVALGSGAGDKLDACNEIAAQLRTDLVLTYVGSGFPAICAGTGFPEPDDPTVPAGVLGSRTDLWLLKLSRIAEGASQFRLTPRDADRTPEVEELVLTFDVAVSEDYDEGVPRRAAVTGSADGEDTVRDALPLLAVLAVCFVVAGLALQHLVLVLQARVAGRRRLRERRLALDARLATLSHFVLRPREAAGRGSVAELYLAALAAFEPARTAEQLDVAEAAFQRADRAARRGAGV